jgi:hypothetical protein
LVVWPLDDLELPEAAAELGDGDLDGDDTPDGVDGSET